MLWIPGSVESDVSPLAVRGVHDGVGEVEGRAEGIQEVDLVAPVVPVFQGGHAALILWYLQGDNSQR